MSNTNVMTVRVPAELKSKITYLAKEQGVSANQFAMYLLTKGIVSVEYEQLVARLTEGRAEDEILRDFKEVMAKISGNDDDVPDWDRLPVTP